VLPGKMAKEVRTKFSNILTRYMAGDASLVGEIVANAESTSPIAQMARAAVAEDSKKRKANREDLEIAERMQALEERKLAMFHVDESHRLENVAMKNKIQDDFAKTTLENIVSRMNAVERLAGLEGIEERDKVAYRALLNAGMSAPSDNNPIIATSIQEVVGAMNFKKVTLTDYQQIGRITSAKYLAAHGSRASQHRQIAADGSTYSVRDYYQEDVPMIQEAANEYMAKKAKQAGGSNAVISFARVVRN
jgi:hypothetical protein